MFDYTNKVILITGSSRGIGSELLQAFSQCHANTIINYNQSETEAISLYKRINKNSIFVQADVTKLSDVNRMYKLVMSTYGRIDVLINNAGICDDSLIQMMSSKQWEKVIDVNLTSMFNCCKVFSKAMIRQKSGKIINISSLKGQLGAVGQVNYAASKAGVIGFTKSLAMELGKFNIAVNAICPGFIVTNLNQNNKEKITVANNKSVLEGSMLYALQDLKNFILFLSSDMVLGVSGQVYNVDSRIL